MAQIDIAYKRLLDSISKMGYKYETENRPGIVCKQVSSVNFEISLNEFPVLTTKKVNWKNIVVELLWFLQGGDNIKFLVDNGVNIWNKDAYNYYKRRVTGEPLEMEDFLAQVKAGTRNITMGGYVYGDVGKGYGANWRGFGLNKMDQVEELIKKLRRNNPIDRGHIVTAWDPVTKDHTALRPCHWSWEIIPRPLAFIDRIQLLCKTEDQGHLMHLWDEMIEDTPGAKEALEKSLKGIPKYSFTLKWNQRSVDVFLGLPYNIASYALLAHIVGHLTNMFPVDIIGNLSNVHIYEPHVEVTKEQRSRDPLKYKGCQLEVSDRFLGDVKLHRKGKITLTQFFKRLEVSDFNLIGYESYGPLKAEMLEPKV